MTRKGQSSMELLAGLGFLLLILLVFLIVANEKLREGNDIKSWLDAKTVCRKFALNIDTIAGQGNSYYKTFKLPETLYKNFEYNLTSYGNRVEISWDSRMSPYSSPIVTSNITIYCLDMGEHKENKVLNDNGSILITCYRPDILFLEDTFYPESVNVGENISISIRIKNFGLVDSGAFTVMFNSEPVAVGSLKVDETKKIEAAYSAPLVPGTYFIPIVLDSNNDVFESIETDNFYNASIRVVLEGAPAPTVTTTTTTTTTVTTTTTTASITTTTTPTTTTTTVTTTTTTVLTWRSGSSASGYCTSNVQCDINYALEDDTHYAGLGYASSYCCYPDGTNCVTSCVNVNFGSIYYTTRIRVDSREDRHACSDSCGSSYCDTSPGQYIFTSNDSSTWTLRGGITRSTSFVTSYITVNTNLRYVLVCRAGGGQLRDNIHVEYVAIETS